MMDRFPRRLLAAALLAAGLTAVPASAARAEDATGARIPLRLLSPSSGTVLAAGTSATLEWIPLAGLGRQDWEEWEAFLSLDGGATYPVRITPHLDRDLRRVTWKVPSLPSANARLLLRVGDERRERVFELPERFTIALPPRATPSPGVLGSALDLRRRVWQRGEPARPGEPGVLAWVEGSRQGGPMVEVVAAEPARAVPGLSLPAGIPVPPAVAAEAPPSGAPAADPGSRSAPLPRQTAAAASVRTLRPRSADILLLIQRQNE
jgi:hypothetical protein